MGAKAKSTAGSPALTFKAGGKKKNKSGPRKRNSENGIIASSATRSGSDDNQSDHGNHNANKQIIMQPTPLLASSSNILSVIQTGIAHKRSPFQLKSWIACVLTLDGRDKFTKVLQYASRLLCWYFAGLAKQTITGSTGDTSSLSSSSSSSLLTNVLNNLRLRQQFYSTISKRFHSLYTSLVTSRKAFRMGRSIIELDKLNSMGWGGYLGYMLMHPLAGGVADAENINGGAIDDGASNKHDNGMEGGAHSLHRYDTHPIPEEEEEDVQHEEEDEGSWSGDEQSMEGSGSDGEEKKLDVPSTSKVKAVSRPGRPKLPTRISSNVGWGPSTTATSVTDAPAPDKDASKNATAPRGTPERTVSELGREMYKPFPSRSSSVGSYRQLEDTQLTSPPPAIMTTPSWKLIGGTIKLLGLMGFWAFDNISFLTTSGFLDPIQLTTALSKTTADGNSGSVVKDRTIRKKRASELAGQCYFFGVVAGMYVNARTLWEHRSGALNDARNTLTSTTSTTKDDIGIEGAQLKLKETEQKHFALMMALLKSCCDFMVFSNNPGIDLHLKLRGRKNHEGLHCLGGLVSAGTVLYNNFPNAK